VAEGAAEATAEEAAEATAEEAAEPGASEQSMALVDAQPTGLAHVLSTLPSVGPQSETFVNKLNDVLPYMEEVFPGGSEGSADAAADFEAQIKALASSAALIQGVLSEQENQGLTDKQWATEYLPSYVAHVSSMFSAPTAVGGADGNEDVSSGTAAAQASVAPPPPAEAFTETSDGFKSEMIGKGVSWHELEKALSVSEVHQVPSTEKMAARAYTGASPAIHRDLNSKLRNAGGPEPPPPDYKHCTHYLQRAVQALPLPAGVTSESILYRGQDGLHGIAYNHGDIVVWPAFTSVSTERGVAEAFSRGSVMFEISGVSEEVGGSVAAISIFKNEAEVVLQVATL
jgi:hypothetical protein